jgi:hypothetical protein
MTTKTRLIAIAILLRFGPSTSAATWKLKRETVAAWDTYLQAANDKMQARLQPGATFLWIDEEPDRADRIRAKRPYIAPMVKDIPRKVPSGLIHDWLGAAVLSLTRKSKTFCEWCGTMIDTKMSTTQA